MDDDRKKEQLKIYNTLSENGFEFEMVYDLQLNFFKEAHMINRETGQLFDVRYLDKFISLFEFQVEHPEFYVETTN